MVGILISLLCFIAEVIAHRIEKVDVPLARQKESRVTLEIEDGHNRDVEDIGDTEV